ncbi:MAG: CaiB/BaiF CoA-transferase family protein [Candidatus Competibacter sp.]|nr:CaiB/BaiF CoA-transferase family protein [Candidatus Competibacter sp.]MDG4584038.1 CaiB/BaiF CoA-transferase family protein [Candidatus Competibacter sp.]
MSVVPTSTPRPLDGIRVLELGQLLAGPFAGTLLAYFGAEVIKVEPPGGDPIRQWRIVRDGASLWWRSLGRNKKCVTLNLRDPAGRALARRLAERCDVLIENFRPGILEGWGLGPDDLKPVNPGLIFARISGYGQDGPYAARPGYASVCEGIGGLRYVNGVPDEPPVRPNLSLGDTFAGLHAAFGVLLALFDRLRRAPHAGQTVDVALYESVFNLLEAVVPEYDGAGAIREPSGSTVTGIVPTGTYRCRDGKYAIIGGNGDSIYKRLMHAAGRADLAEDPRLAHNAGRVEHQAEIDAALAAWTATLDSGEALARLAAADVPAGPIYNVADMVADPHFQARGLFETVEIDGKPLKIPAILPRLAATPGATDWPGPEIGRHNAEVFGGLLGLSEVELATLKGQGVF